MSVASVHDLQQFRGAVASAGAVLLSAAPGRAQAAMQPSGAPGDILEALLSSSFARSVAARALAGAPASSESASEPMFGLLVIPVRMPRRLVSERLCAVTLLLEGIEGETLEMLAQRAGIDARIARTVLRASSPWERRNCGRLAQVVGSLARAESDRLAGLEAGTQLGAAWEELHLLHSLSGRMAVGASPSEFVQRTLAELRQTLGCRWAALRLDEGAAALLDADAGSVLVDAGGHAERGSGDMHFARHLMHELGEVGRAAVVGTDLVVAPVVRERIPFGVLAAGARTEGDGAMSSCERTLVETAAGNLAVFLDNARLYRDLDRMFIGALSALVSAIDAKDPYTRGHSQRVALLARQIAVAAGLSEQETRDIYIAGLVHDVGKIGVPEAVLRKQGRLTDDEFAQVKQHPEIGWRILRGIPRFGPVLDGVRFHHERYDGAGYPHGIAGRAIPLAARIVCIADTFDAMSSNRTYRRARPRAEVLGELQRLAGVQFDPSLLERFLEVDLSAYDALMASDACVAEPGDASSLDAIHSAIASGARSVLPVRGAPAADGRRAA